MEIPGYILEHRIGQGRFASLYLAKDTFGVVRVIKIIKSSLSDQKLFRQEFKKHIKPLTTINHPNCIKIYDAGIIDKTCYMVMDYFPDGSIAPRLIFGFPVRHIIKIVLELIDALEYLKQFEVEHRNVQPRNIFLKQNNQTVLSEYEVVSQILNDCPEIKFEEDQLLKQLVDCQTDVNCLGLLFFKLLNRETTPYLEIPSKSLSGRRALCWQPTINKLFSSKHDETISDIYQLRHEIHRVEYEFKDRINQQHNDKKIAVKENNKTTNELVVYSNAHSIKQKVIEFPALLKSYRKNKFDLESFLLNNKVPIMTGLSLCTSFVIIITLFTYFDNKYDSDDTLSTNTRPDILFPLQEQASHKKSIVAQSHLTEADIRQKERLNKFKLKQDEEQKRLALIQFQQEQKRLTALKLLQEEERLIALEKKQEAERLAALKLQEQQEAEHLAALKLQEQQEAERLAALKLQEQETIQLAILKQKKEELLISLKHKKEDDRLIALKEKQEKERVAAIKNKIAKQRRIAAKKKQKEIELQNKKKLEAVRLATSHLEKIQEEKLLRQQRMEFARVQAEKEELVIQDQQRQEQANKLEKQANKPKFESFATF